MEQDVRTTLPRIERVLQVTRHDVEIITKMPEVLWRQTGFGRGRKEMPKQITFASVLLHQHFGHAIHQLEFTNGALQVGVRLQESGFGQYALGTQCVSDFLSTAIDRNGQELADPLAIAVIGIL